MKLDKIFEPNLLLSFVITLLIIGIDSKQGWKTSGKGYMEYKTSTNFRFENKLVINGTFATTQNNPNDNMLVAAEDSNGYKIFTVVISKGETTINTFTVADGKGPKMHGNHSVGKIIPFAIIISNKTENGDRYVYEFSTEGLSHTKGDSMLVEHKSTWNFDNITIFIGGYKKNPKTNFQGCLSDFLVNRFNIIDQYFDYYPDNTNPKLVGNFNEGPEKCDNLNRSPTEKDSATPENQSTIETNTKASETASSSFRPEPIGILADLLCALISFRIKISAQKSFFYDSLFKFLFEDYFLLLKH